mgnify:CR=1 FL=1
MTNEREDEIVEEIRRRREAHAAAFDFDLQRIAEDLRRQEKEAGVPLVSRPPREPQDLPKRSSA